MIIRLFLFLFFIFFLNTMLICACHLYSFGTKTRDWQCLWLEHITEKNPLHPLKLRPTTLEKVPCAYQVDYRLIRYQMYAHTYSRYVL